MRAHLLFRPAFLMFASLLCACPPPGGPDYAKMCKDQNRDCGPPVDPLPTIEVQYSCGTCSDSSKPICSANGKCSERVCTPFCAMNAECGDDGCGGKCGAGCAAGLSCAKSKCVADCTPNCEDKECGDNGCGGSCGTCTEAGSECKADQYCAPVEWTTCAGKDYTDQSECNCGCGTKDPDCDLADSFLSGCGLGEFCDSLGACAPIAPSGWTCLPDQYNDGVDCHCACGVPDPDCDIASAPVMNCPKSNDACTNGSCGPCTPSCGDHECGGDGCGGNCGPTGPVSATGPSTPEGNGTGRCKDFGLCISGFCNDPCPTLSKPLLCWTRECGPNYCGGDCGTCDPGKECNNLGRCVAPDTPAADDSCKDLGCTGRAKSGCYCDANCSRPDRNNCCPDQPAACCERQCTGKECGSDGCGGECGSGCGPDAFCKMDFTCAPDAPTGLVMSAPTGSYQEGSPIPAIVAYSLGGWIESYSILPSLPAGLSIATGSGRISGTPSETSPGTIYTVTGTNETSSTTTTLSIAITAAPPANLSYANNPVVYTEGTTIAPNVPTRTGGTPTNYYSTPALPNGLSFGPTGVISGTPGAAAPTGTYTVTAENGVGDTSVNLVIRVRPRAPSGLSYTDESPLYTVGAAISINSPSLTLGTATSYTVMPALPLGLMINSTTGAITGTPTQAIMNAMVEVTAANETGTTTVMLAITVNAAPLGDWTVQASPTANNAESGDGYGANVAIAGDILVVGAPYEGGDGIGVYSPTGPDNNNKPGSGAVYVYRRNGSAWDQEAYLKSDTPVTNDNPRFGTSVAISGNTIIVGAPEENFPNDGTFQAGAAYIYFHNGTSWLQQGHLVGPTGAVGTPFESAFFGNDVAIDGNTAVVGSSNENGSGAAYVYVRNAGVWTRQARLVAPNVENGDRFGMSVAVSADTVIIGADGEDGGGLTQHGASVPLVDDDSVTLAGAAYVYTRSGVVWTQQAYLKAGNVAPGQQANFGVSVALDGNTALIGAQGESSDGQSVYNGPTGPTNALAGSSGAAYVFTRSVNTWTQQAILKATNADSLDTFGESVALVGNTALVGARSEQSLSNVTVTGPSGGSGSTLNNGNSVGAAYLFTRAGITWGQAAYFKASAPASFDLYGQCALSDTTIVIGAQDASGGGASFIYERN